jgi:hypothetical protein
MESVALYVPICSDVNMNSVLMYRQKKARINGPYFLWGKKTPSA